MSRRRPLAGNTRSLLPTRGLIEYARSLNGRRDDEAWIGQKLAAAALKIAHFAGSASKA